MTVAQIAASAIFLIVYVCIASERVDKAVATLAGATLMLLTGILTQHEAFHDARRSAGEIIDRFGQQPLARRRILRRHARRPSVQRR